MLSHSYAFGRRRLILNTSITSHFPYCLILWMFHSRKLNERTDSIHERAIRVVCKEYESSFQELIIVGNSLNIRHWNLQKVLTETFKFKNCSWPGLAMPGRVCRENHTLYEEIRISSQWESVWKIWHKNTFLPRP